ncbi:MAG: class I SAM-dependent methyltransferase [Rhodobacter sp.]|nr:class I SAM-dependent methyltransferase [Rhodobacter sp.]
MTGGSALYTDPSLAGLYDSRNPWGADFDFCVKAAENARSVLDLGCGTGMLAASLAKTHDVTGVDPAGPMLDIARARPGGDRVTWVTGDARSLDLRRSFDLIVMTGHAFQTLLTDSDIAAALTTIADHLAPAGRFLFDSRNPAATDLTRWGPDHSHSTREHPDLGPIERYSTYSQDGEIVHYVEHYTVRATGARFSGGDSLRFAPKPTLDRLLSEAGLTSEPCFGDWTGAPWTPQAADMVFHGGHA